MFWLFIGALERSLFLNISTIEDIKSKLTLFIVLFVLELLKFGWSTSNSSDLSNGQIMIK